MNTPYLTAVAVVLLASTSTLAGEEPGNVQQGLLSQLSEHRFTEADLKQLEHVHVTSATAATIGDPVQPRAIQFGDATDSLPLYQWHDANGKRWSVTLDEGPNHQGLMIHAPMITADAVTDDAVGPADEADSMSSTPAPASLAMATIGMTLIYPKRQRKDSTRPSSPTR